MRMEFLQRLGGILVALSWIGVHPDVAPPVDLYVFGCGLLIVLGILVVGVVVVSVLAIRAIKKKAGSGS